MIGPKQRRRARRLTRTDLLAARDRYARFVFRIYRTATDPAEGDAERRKRLIDACAPEIELLNGRGEWK